MDQARLPGTRLEVPIEDQEHLEVSEGRAHAFLPEHAEAAEGGAAGRIRFRQAMNSANDREMDRLKMKTKVSNKLVEMTRKNQYEDFLKDKYAAPGDDNEVANYRSPYVAKPTEKRVKMTAKKELVRELESYEKEDEDELEPNDQECFVLEMKDRVRIKQKNKATQDEIFGKP